MCDGADGVIRVPTGAETGVFIVYENGRLVASQRSRPDLGIVNGITTWFVPVLPGVGPLWERPTVSGPVSLVGVLSSLERGQ